jgi:hypothetical protein
MRRRRLQGLRNSPQCRLYLQIVERPAKGSRKLLGRGRARAIGWQWRRQLAARAAAAACSSAAAIRRLGQQAAQQRGRAVGERLRLQRRRRGARHAFIVAVRIDVAAALFKVVNTSR